MSEEVFTKECAKCGKLIEFTYSNKALRFCPECKAERKREQQKDKNRRFKEKHKEIEKAKRIAHQQDTSVWTHDYAERQKAKTLELVRGLW